MSVHSYEYHTAERYACACDGYLKAERDNGGHVPLEERVHSGEAGAWCKFCKSFFSYAKAFNKHILESL
jgi:hypothetical protein